MKKWVFFGIFLACKGSKNCTIQKIFVNKWTFSAHDASKLRQNEEGPPTIFFGNHPTAAKKGGSFILFAQRWQRLSAPVALSYYVRQPKSCTSTHQSQTSFLYLWNSRAAERSQHFTLSRSTFPQKCPQSTKSHFTWQVVAGSPLPSVLWLPCLPGLGIAPLEARALRTQLADVYPKFSTHACSALPYAPHAWAFPCTGCHWLLCQGSVSRMPNSSGGQCLRPGCLVAERLMECQNMACQLP